MTADLKEVFHVAAVVFVRWQHLNEEQSQWGWINTATGRREYQPEPTVEFFGRNLSLSEICAHASVLSGNLPPHIFELFAIVDGGTGQPLPKTYSEAVETLATAVECEHYRQILDPLIEPPQVDRIRTHSFGQGFNTALAIIAEKVGSA